MRGGASLAAAAIALILFLPPFSIADTETQYYDEWHYSGDSFKAEGEIILVTHIRFSDDRIVLSAGPKSSTINVGDCWVTSEKKYCLKEIYRDIANATTSSHLKFSGREVYAGLHLTFYKLNKEVMVSRSFAPGSPKRGEEVTVEVTIDNPTLFSTENFQYTDSYPEGVIIVSGAGELDKGLRSVAFSKNIPPQSKKSFTYSFKILDYLNFENAASVKYSLAGKQVSFNTSSFSTRLGIEKPYSSSMALTPQRVETGQEAKLTISLTNKLSGKDLEVSKVEFSAPTTAFTVLTGDSEFASQGVMGSYALSTRVQPNKTKTVTAGVKSYDPGEYKIPVEVTIKEAEGVFYVERTTLSLSTYYSEPELIISPKDAIVLSGSPFRVAVSVKNPNTYTWLKNVHASIESNFSPYIQGFKQDVMPLKTETVVVNPELIAPDFEEESRAVVRVKGQYSTNFNEKGSFERDVSVKVLPANKTISLTISVEALPDLRPGGNFTIIVKAMTSSKEKIKATIKDSYSAGLALSAGTTSASIELDSSKESQAYIYTLAIPQDYEATDLFVKTEASVPAKGFSTFKVLILKVNQTGKQPVSEGGSVQEGTEIQEVPAAEAGLQSNGIGAKQVDKGSGQGVVARTVDKVFNFFRRMFGLK